MKKRILSLVVAVGLVASLGAPGHSYAGPTVEQMKKQLADLQKQRQELERNASNAKNQVARIQSEKAQTAKDIQTIMREIDKTNEKLTQLDEEVEQVTAELEDNIQQLGEAEDRVETRDNLLRSRLRLMYMNGFVSYMDVLLSATNFSDFLDRLNALQSILNQDKEILENNMKDRG